MRLASIESEPWEISASTSIGTITCLPFIDKSTKEEVWSKPIPKN